MGKLSDRGIVFRIRLFKASVRAGRGTTPEVPWDEAISNLPARRAPSEGAGGDVIGKTACGANAGSNKGHSK